MCHVQSFLYCGKIHADVFCSNGLEGYLFKIFLRAGRRLETRVRVIGFGLVCFFSKGFLENRTGSACEGTGGRSGREAAEGEPLPRRCSGAALRGGGNRAGEPSRGLVRLLRRHASSQLASAPPSATPGPEPPQRGKEVRDAAALLLPGDAGRAGAEPRWRRGGCGGGSVRCGVAGEGTP